ncbi:MAG: FtsQ-type POTRA domain-containing protein [Ilumatobacteraceae bacterium]
MPGADVPSAEVLDELLRAFSVDVNDEARNERVDLDSPEVEELLTPAAADPDEHPMDPRPHDEVETEREMAAGRAGDVDREVEAEVTVESEVEVTVESEVEVDVESEVEVEVEPEVEVDVETGPAPGAEIGTSPGATPAGLSDEPAGALAAGGPSAAVAESPAEPSPAEPATDVTPGPRTIVIDAAHDPPDAVYLTPGDPLLNRPVGASAAGSATVDPAATSGDTTIFIDDRPTGQTLTLEEATGSATRMEPRLRDRRIAVKRGVGRRRLRWAIAALVVIGLVVAALAVLGSGLFAIEDVEVEGVVYTDPAKLDEVVQQLLGEPVLRADTDEAERELELIPWVEAARVTTDFPHGATIEIRERVATATFEGPDGRYRVIDTHGRVLDVLDGEPVEYMTIISADAPAIEAGQFSPQGFAAAASLVQALTPELEALAQSVAVTGDGSDLRMMMSNGIEARFGAARDLVTKLVLLQTSLDKLDVAGMSYIDVSTNEVTTG